MNFLDRVNKVYLTGFLKEIPHIFFFSVMSMFKNKKIRPKSILIVNLHLIGDFMNSLPAMSDFVKKHNFSNVDVVVSSACYDLIKEDFGFRNVFIEKVVFKERNYSFESHSYEKNKYDWIIILRGSSDFAKKLRKMKYSNLINGYDLLSKYYLMYYLLNKKDLPHISDIYYETMNMGKNKKVRYKFVPKKENIFEMKKKIGSYNFKYKKMIVINIGSGWNYKLLPSKTWQGFFNSVSKCENVSDFLFVFIGRGKHDMHNFNQLNLRNIQHINLIDKLSLDKTTTLIYLSDLFIGVDSGPMHIASLCDTKLITFLGVGIHKIFGPYSKNAIVINKSVCDKCPLLVCHAKKKNWCMGKVTSKDIFLAFLKSVK